MSGRKSQPIIGSQPTRSDLVGFENDLQPTRSDLQSQETFDQSFSLLPWRWDGYYTLNIETRSFGQRAENIIYPVEVRWFPIEQIAKSRITPTRSDLVGFDQDLQPTRSDLRVTQVRKTGTWLYGVGVKFNSQITNDKFSNGEQGLIRLSQGYDEGWVGLAVSASNNQFSIFNFQKLEHVKVDGWANGWILRQAQDGLNGEQEPQMVVIFYWPQLLEYLGFVFLITTGVALIYGRKS